MIKKVTVPEVMAAKGKRKLSELTAYDYPQYAAAALRLGASGFVLKTAPIAELVEAIRRAASGGLAFGVRPVGLAGSCPVVLQPPFGSLPTRSITGVTAASICLHARCRSSITPWRPAGGPSGPW